jgi:hypothetical protein
MLLATTNVANTGPILRISVIAVRLRQALRSVLLR